MNDRLRVLQRQPRRVSITLSHHVHEALLNRSEEEGRSVSNLCAYLLEEALRHDSGAGRPKSSEQLQPQYTEGNGHRTLTPRGLSQGHQAYRPNP
jgi:hypothetical protein